VHRAFLLVLILGVAACGGDDNTTSPSDQASLVILDIVVGTGPVAAVGDTVRTHYVGRLTDGTQFDTSRGGEPFEFVLGAGQVIAGWDQGVPGMRVGGTRRLTIPPHLAYGSSGAGPIPPNSTLTFDIELVEIVG
jgi:FKBP-type peptidyl-prolyl cis-trans isomerase